MTEQAKVEASGPAGADESVPHGRRWTGLLLALPLLGFLGLAALFYVRLGVGDASRIPSALIGKPVPSFSLPVIAPAKPGEALAQRPATFSNADLKQGSVTLVNIFASWCVPCHEEHALLMRLAADKMLAAMGVRLVGIAFKDDVVNTLRFLGSEGNPYAVIGDDKPGRAAIDWGVYGVPETFIVKGDGTIAYKFIGPMTEEAVTGVIIPEIERAAP